MRELHAGRHHRVEHGQIARPTDTAAAATIQFGSVLLGLGTAACALAMVGVDPALVWTSLGLALAVPAVSYLWRWCQPAAVVFSVVTGLTASLTVALVMAPDRDREPEPDPGWDAVSVVVAAGGVSWL